MTSTPEADQIRVLGDRAQQLSKLTEHPSWATLKEELGRVREMYQTKLSRKLTTGGINAPPLDQREIDYQRGFFAGAKWILDNPDLAESTLQTALDRRERGSG